MNKPLSPLGWLALAAGFLPVTALVVVNCWTDFASLILWHLLPVIAALVMLGGAFGRSGRRWTASLAFGVAAVGILLDFHLSWHAGWREDDSESSTSKLTIAFVPLWSLLVGAVLSGVAWLLADLVFRVPPSAP